MCYAYLISQIVDTKLDFSQTTARVGSLDNVEYSPRKSEIEVKYWGNDESVCGLQ